MEKNESVGRDLFENAMQGKWEEVVKIYRKCPWVRKERITAGGNTALHIAVSDRQADVVKELVQVIGGQQNVLDIKNEQGNIPLHLAASVGKVSICSCMARKDPKLVGVCNEEGETPLFLAAHHGRIDAFFCLLDLSSSAGNYEYLRNKKGETILHCAIAGGYFRMAFLIAQRCGDLVNSFNEKGESPLHLLASKPAAFKSGSHLNVFDKIIYHCVFVQEFYHPVLAGAEDSKNPTLTELLTFRWSKIRVPSAFGGKTAQKASGKTDTPANPEGSGSNQDQGYKFTKDEKSEQLENKRQFPQNFDTCFNFIKLVGIFNFLKFPIRALCGSLWRKISKDQHNDEAEEHPIDISAEILETGSSIRRDSQVPKLATHKHSGDERSRERLRQYLENQRSFPPNYDTCFSFITFLIKGILVIIFFGLGQSYVNDIQKKKEKNIWSFKVMHLLLDNKNEYDRTGKDPRYSERTMPFSMKGEMEIKMEKGKETSVTDLNVGELEAGQVEEVEAAKQAPTEEVKKAKEVVKLAKEDTLQREQRASPGEVEKANEVKVAKEDTSQKNCLRHDSSEEDANWALLLRLGKAGLLSEPIIVAGQAAKKLDDELFKETKKNNEEAARLETPILIAAKNGIIEMVKKILDLYPVAIHDINSEKKNIVLLAVENRHPQVYEHLRGRNILKDSVFRAVDNVGNSALHLAAMFTDNRPWRTPGAALQMQWEVKWYEYVRGSMPANFFASHNSVNETAKQIFTREHKDLVQRGGQWLTSTATSCSVVATLIATVAFATSTSVPGGITEGSGKPNLGQQPTFHIFAISSLIALCFSVTSTVMFLSILTSRYQEKDFGHDLPRKLLIGLTSLFVSILAMMVTFCAGHFFVLRDELRIAALPVYAMTCLPATFFAIAQLPLYIDLILATFTNVPQPLLEEDA